MQPINVFLISCVCMLGFFALNLAAGGVENIPFYLGAITG